MGSSCIVCKSFSDNEATASVASLIFLNFRLAVVARRAGPVPHDPAQVAQVGGDDPGVDEDQVAVGHGGEVEEGLPGHPVISVTAGSQERLRER